MSADSASGDTSLAEVAEEDATQTVFVIDQPGVDAVIAVNHHAEVGAVEALAEELSDDLVNAVEQCAHLNRRNHRYDRGGGK
ncbi:hypothetical protein [Halorarius litoreus]|uniref:hypothetical protein n=1 Tax=Halorarius litoreus TaxID=2962676 RepID=UPI0020CF37DA|nr:hypothetical protein [Halorarius litoreus]